MNRRISQHPRRRGISLVPLLTTLVLVTALGIAFPAVRQFQRTEEGIVTRVADGDTVTVTTPSQTKRRVQKVPA